MFTNCSLRHPNGDYPLYKLPVLLALPPGIEPGTCGLGSLFGCSLAFSSNFRSPPPLRMLTVALCDAQRWTLVNVHSTVHSRGDIHPCTPDACGPLAIARVFTQGSMVISTPRAPTHSGGDTNSSATKRLLSVRIIVRQWSNIPVSLFGCPPRRFRNSNPWHVFDAEVAGKWSERRLTSTSPTDFERQNRLEIRDVGAEPLGKLQTPC